MNSAISYMTAAQSHADAVRDGYRDPHPRVRKTKPAETKARQRPRLLRTLHLVRV